MATNTINALYVVIKMHLKNIWEKIKCQMLFVKAECTSCMLFKECSQWSLGWRASSWINSQPPKEKLRYKKAFLFRRQHVALAVIRAFKRNCLSSSSLCLATYEKLWGTEQGMLSASLRNCSIKIQPRKFLLPEKITRAMQYLHEPNKPHCNTLRLGIIFLKTRIKLC